MNKGLSLLGDKQKCVIGFYIIFSINTGLRISDILNIKHKDLVDEKLVVVEKKTQKQRVITLKDVVRKAYTKLVSLLVDADVRFSENAFIFISQKGSVYKTQSINDCLQVVHPYKIM